MIDEEKIIKLSQLLDRKKHYDSKAIDKFEYVKLSDIQKIIFNIINDDYLWTIEDEKTYLIPKQIQIEVLKHRFLQNNLEQEDITDNPNTEHLYELYKHIDDKVKVVLEYIKMESEYGDT